MENKFEMGDGLETLLFLQEKLGAEVVYTGQCLVHLKLKRSVPDGDVIGYNETAKHRCPVFYASDDLCFIFELPTCENGLKYAFYAKPWMQDEVARKFGGFCVGNYWLLNNETRSYYGYKGDKLPEASEIIEFAETFLSH